MNQINEEIKHHRRSNTKSISVPQIIFFFKIKLLKSVMWGKQLVAVTILFFFKFKSLQWQTNQIYNSLVYFY